MERILLTKNGLREEQRKLSQLKTYLPTLKLKKAMIQAEIVTIQNKINNTKEELNLSRKETDDFAFLLTDRVGDRIIFFSEAVHVKKRYENVAGIELPIFEAVVFKEPDFLLFDTPIWIDAVILKIRNVVILKERLLVEEEMKRTLEKEFKEVSIRVNLFEKILIPKSLKNINRIKIFLGDQALAAVAQAKMSKLKIEKKKLFQTGRYVH